MFRITIAALGLLSSIVISQNSYANERYKEGYVVTIKGDTLRGLIKDKKGDANPSSVSFKSNQDAKQIKYGLSELLSFEVGYQRYIRAEIDVEVSPRALSELDYVGTYIVERTVGFLEVLFDGPKSLYYYKASYGNENFYIRDENDKIQLLLYKRYLNKPGTQKIKEERKFLGQLSLYLQECEGIDAKLQILNYNRGALVNLYDYYYKHSSFSSSYEQKKGKFSTKISIVGGPNISSIKFSQSGSTEYATLDQMDFQWGNGFTVGVSLESFKKANLGHFSVVNDLLINQFKSEGDNKSLALEKNQYYYDHASFNYLYFKWMPQIRYRFELNNWIVFGDIGLTGGAVLYEDTSLITSNLEGTNVVDHGAVFNKSSSFQYGGVIGLGTGYKRLSLEVKYEYTDGMAPSVSSEAGVQRIHMLIGFRF